ncbi:uncharacterized protein An09g02200 [Aspergillus niger]|uniref:Contig An09c0050, genomic contig n=2 Tax=Aspergillus niger TaxID=5061 RepID=A2QTI2_ASPNC|nr:uncharacterized protein An09g02200 [Aspergillus niger]CAK40157.1 unnamed protein product [Aspergillus niger]
MVHLLVGFLLGWLPLAYLRAVYQTFPPSIEYRSGQGVHLVICSVSFPNTLLYSRKFNHAIKKTDPRQFGYTKIETGMPYVSAYDC